MHGSSHGHQAQPRLQMRWGHSCSRRQFQLSQGTCVVPFLFSNDRSFMFAQKHFKGLSYSKKKLAHKIVYYYQWHIDVQCSHGHRHLQCFRPSHAQVFALLELLFGLLLRMKDRLGNHADGWWCFRFWPTWLWSHCFKTLVSTLQEWHFTMPSFYCSEIFDSQALREHDKQRLIT